ncbi:MAG: DUF3089 domain-containing protein [Crocinitomicaceae bacterium]
MRQLILISIIIIQQFALNSQIEADYSNLDHWLISPDNKNKLHEAYIKDSSLIEYADVFYIYPTVFLDKKDPNWNVSIDNEEQRNKAIRVTRFQASAWAEAGRMFVPYYSQANLRSYTSLETGGRTALLKAYKDVKAAFSYYLENHNKGRPIILAGHSQGSTHAMLLLKDFFDGKALQEQLVCAYLPGIGINEDEYQSIPLLTNEIETGGFVSWNTFKRRYKTKKYKNWYQGKAAINPVTWDLQAIAKREKHKGFLFQDDKMYTQSFHTHVADGAVWISLPHVPFRSFAWTLEDYHIGDVNLFWKDIQSNAKTRVVAYQQKDIAKSKKL